VHSSYYDINTIIGPLNNTKQIRDGINLNSNVLIYVALTQMPHKLEIIPQMWKRFWNLLSPYWWQAKTI